MAISAIVGQAQGFDAREAGSQAALNAISKASRRSILAGFIFASDFFNFTQVISGVKAILGDAPLIGFSTSGGLSSTGLHQKSVIIALLVGNDLFAESNWWPDFGVDSKSVSQKMIESFNPNLTKSIFFAVADGFHGDAQEFCQSIPEGFSFAGCLSGGDFKQARSFQLGGQNYGNGGLAGLCMKGDLIAGVGLDSGWQDVGAFFTVTRVRGPWIQTLNDQPVTTIYSQWLGFDPRDWSFPPLNRLVRLYPLGVESGSDSLIVRSPLRIENDGSMRLHTQVPVGSTVHLMAGSIESCISAAQKAIEQALISLGKARPILALVFPDVAWQILLETRPGAEIQAINKILGDNVPLAGGYVLGQLARQNEYVGFYNQSIQVILIADSTG